MMHKMTMIIYRHSVNSRFKVLPDLAKMFEGSYDAGWMIGNENRCIIMSWANVKDQYTARKLMNDVLQKQGNRKVLFYDKEITETRQIDTNVIHLTVKQYKEIINESELWNNA